MAELKNPRSNENLCQLSNSGWKLLRLDDRFNFGIKDKVDIDLKL